MNPFYFGTGQRQLFGLYTPARTAGASARAIVLCHPWGSEYLYAQRSMRQLASMLTAAGFHVLRFDYFGTGDSASDMTQADLKGWEDDIEMAIEELKDTTEAKRVALVGLRLGATLAASVAAKRRKDVDALVLWDPIVSGNEYLLELMRYLSSRPLAEVKPAANAPEVCCGYEIRGFRLTENMVREFRTINLCSLVPALPARTLVVMSEEGQSHDVLGAALAGRYAGPLVIEQIVSPPAWLEDGYSGAAIIPIKILQRIVEWFR